MNRCCVRGSVLIEIIDEIGSHRAFEVNSFLEDRGDGVVRARLAVWLLWRVEERGCCGCVVRCCVRMCWGGTPSDRWDGVVLYCLEDGYMLWCCDGSYIIVSSRLVLYCTALYYIVEVHISYPMLQEKKSRSKHQPIGTSRRSVQKTN